MSESWPINEHPASSHPLLGVHLAGDQFKQSAAQAEDTSHPRSVSPISTLGNPSDILQENEDATATDHKYRRRSVGGLQTEHSNKFSSRSLRMTSPIHEKQNASIRAQRLPQSKEGEDARKLERHFFGLFIVGLFVTATLLSWIITCILCYRPIGIRTYYDTNDQDGTVWPYQWANNNQWRKAGKTISSIVASVGVPVTSAICAKAAAVYCQRNSASQPSLTVRQTLALADKGWTDVAVLRDVVTPSRSGRTRSPLLLLAAFLCGIALLIPVLQGALVDTAHIRVLVRQEPGKQAIGQQLASGSLVSSDPGNLVESINQATIAVKYTDKQPNLWMENTSSANLGIADFGVGLNDTHNFYFPMSEYFTTAFSVGTDTDILRALGLRLNSSLTCESVEQSNFPAPCPGLEPFTKNFSYYNASGSSATSTSPLLFNVRVCAPGNISASPWRKNEDVDQFFNRQDIFEEFYLDLQSTDNKTLLTEVPGDWKNNFTQHCHANSTVGYFELPNSWNNHTAGILMNTVGLDSTEQYANSLLNGLKDRELGQGVRDSLRLAATDRISNVWHAKTPGPLSTSLLAIFGPGSFFDTATSFNSSNSSTVCNNLRMPFTGLQSSTSGVQWLQKSPEVDCHIYSDEVNDPLAVALFKWLINFLDDNRTTAALTTTLLQSSRAILDPEMDMSISLRDKVYRAQGSDLQKPHMPAAAMVIISALIAVQIAGLILLALYASSRHTWTESLDGFALLRLGAAMAEDLPLISSMKVTEVAVLDERKGWIADEGTEEIGGMVNDGPQGIVRRLAVGGREPTRSGGVYKMVNEDE